MAVLEQWKTTRLYRRSVAVIAHACRARGMRNGEEYAASILDNWFFARERDTTAYMTSSKEARKHNKQHRNTPRKVKQIGNEIEAWRIQDVEAHVVLQEDGTRKTYHRCRMPWVNFKLINALFEFFGLRELSMQDRGTSCTTEEYQAKIADFKRRREQTAKHAQEQRAKLERQLPAAAATLPQDELEELRARLAHLQAQPASRVLATQIRFVQWRMRDVASKLTQ